MARSVDKPNASAISDLSAQGMSETDRMIAREDKRLAQSTGTSLRVTRRALLGRVAALSAAWTVSPWLIDMPSTAAKALDEAGMTQTLEAFADTLIPGQKRSPTDRAIAGVVKGPGAVQGGALRMMNFPPLGVQAALPGLAFTLNLYAFAYAVSHKITLHLTVPPFVELDFESRTALLLKIFEGTGQDRAAFTALAALTFAAFNTAGYLPTAEAIENGHPGLATIGFPAPNKNGVWRFPKFSYRRILAKPHPNARRGNPA
jgi:enediyne biosynthesis protein E8